MQELVPALPVVLHSCPARSRLVADSLQGRRSTSRLFARGHCGARLMLETLPLALHREELRLQVTSAKGLQAQG